MNTVFPYKEQLEKIEDHSIEELMHLQLMQQIESNTTQLDELDAHLDEVTYLYQLQDTILLKGVTPAICEDCQEHMWTKYEFDLEPFVNSSNEQLSYCMEGLGSIITRILLKIKEIINAVMEWFSTESIFRTWFNNMSYYKRQIGILFSQYDPKRNMVLKNVYSRQFISGYDYQTWRKLLYAMCVLIRHLNAINVPTDISKFGDTQTTAELNSKLAECGYVFDQGHIYANGKITYRRDTILAMGWQVNNVLGEKDDLLKFIFAHDLDMSRLKYALNRATIQWSREIDNLLKQQQAGMDGGKIKMAQDMKNGCVLLKRITRLIMQQSSGMAAQWCRMVRLFDAAMPSANGKDSGY